MLTALLVVLAASPVPSQEGAGLTLTGRVVEAGEPDRGVGFADVELYSLPAGTPVEPLLAVESGGRPVAADRTDASGRYEIEGLTGGDYIARVSRFGYGTERVHVRLAIPVSRLSVALTPDPLPLLGLDALGRRLQAGDLREPLAGAAPEVEDLRRQRWLSNDARILTRRDIQRSATLAEPDVFRSLQRLPAVSASSDWSAAPWTRGARWDLTLTRFDGVPMFNPYHAGGILSAVPTDLVGSVAFQPGVAPAALPGGGAAILDVTSRGGPPSGPLTGEAMLSLASASLSLAGTLPGRPGSWRVQARRSYLDWLAEAFARSADGSVPYAFHDVGGRADLPLGEHLLEVSGLIEHDGIEGEIPDVVHGSVASWWNGVARATLSSELFGRRGRHTIGFSRYGLRVDSIESVQPEELNAPGLTAGRHGVAYAVARGEYHGAPADDAWSWGWELARWSVDADGPPPRPFLDYDTDALVEPLRGGALTVGAAWAEARLRPSRAVELDLGLRIETGGEVPGAGDVRAAPRLALRLHPADRVAISAGAGRSWQYVQALSPILMLDQDFPAGYLWALAGADAPAVRADVVTVGVEGRLGARWLAGGTLWLRRNQGVVTPATEAGLLDEGDLFSPVSARAHGAEAYARRVGDGWSFQGGYSWLVSRETSRFGSHPAPGDRRHVIDLSGSLSLSPSVRADLSFTRASGAPYTRVRQVCTLECPDDAPLVLGQPNALRSEPYSGLQLGIEWTRSAEDWEMGVSLQIRNVLARSNRGAYSGTERWCPDGAYSFEGDRVYCGEGGRLAELRDTFTPGMPLLPLLGLRVRF